MAKKKSPAAPSGSAAAAGQSPPSPSSSTASHPPSKASGSTAPKDDETDPKKIARRERNRLAASAFRNRKKERLEGLEGRLGTLQTENSSLKGEVARLMDQLAQLGQQARDRGLDLGPPPVLPALPSSVQQGDTAHLAASFKPDSHPVPHYPHPPPPHSQFPHQQPPPYPYPPQQPQFAIQAPHLQPLHHTNAAEPSYFPPQPPTASDVPVQAPTRPQQQPIQQELTYNKALEPHHADSYFPVFEPSEMKPSPPRSPEQNVMSALKRKATDASLTSLSSASSSGAMPPPSKIRRSARTTSNLALSAATPASVESSPAALEEDEEVKSLSPDGPSSAAAATEVRQAAAQLAAQPIHIRRATQDVERSAPEAAVQANILPPLPSFPPPSSASNPTLLTSSFPLPTSLFSPGSASRFLGRQPPLSPFIDAHGMQSPFAMGLHALGSAGGVAGLNVSDIRTPSPGTSVGGGDGGYFGWGSRN